MIILKGIRANWLKVVVPEVDEESGKETYKMTVIVPKTDVTNLALIKQEFENGKATAIANPTKFGEKAKILKFDTLKDGDSEEAKLSKYNQPNEGNYFFTVKNSHQPLIIGPNCKPLEDLTLLYSGMYCNVKLSTSPWSYKGKCGVSYYLDAIQYIDASGINLGGGRVSADGFEHLEDSALEEEPDVAFVPQPKAQVKPKPQKLETSDSDWNSI
jgi:hypothetical protein